VKKIHLIGICGTAMATLALLLKQRGYQVTGSDEHIYPPMSDLLHEHGIPLPAGYDAAHVPPDSDLVVIGNAVSRGNPEVEIVLDRRMRYASLPEVVRNEFLWERRSLVVSGTHGKTTTSFMLAWILTEAGVDPSFLVGGISRNLGTSGRLGSGSAFVIEGDEYDSAFFDKTAKFLKYLPEVVVVNNLEFDHADIYHDLDELRVSFRRLVRMIPGTGRLIASADDPEARELARGGDTPCPVETFGLEASADWCAREIAYGTVETSFDVVRRGVVAARVTLPMLGDFNVRNALGAIAAAAAVDVPTEQAAHALAAFLGVKRRLEIRGVARDVTVYDDFAHHPTAVRETLLGLRSAGGAGRLWAVFEPRSATSCRRIFQTEFAEAFRHADEVVVAAVQRTTIPDNDRLSERELVDDLRATGVSARFESTVDAVVRAVAANAAAGDRVVVMSNGGFGGIHQKLLTALAGGEDEAGGAAP